jgi:hypothetical protein
LSSPTDSTRRPVDPRDAPEEQQDILDVDTAVTVQVRRCELAPVQQEARRTDRAIQVARGLAMGWAPGEVAGEPAATPESSYYDLASYCVVMPCVRQATGGLLPRLGEIHVRTHTIPIRTLDVEGSTDYAAGPLDER